MIEIVVDEYTSNENEKCNNCKGKFICDTKCCQKKLCQFHLRMYKEDGKVKECEHCIEIIHHDDNKWSRGNGFIFCNEHLKNELIFCNECEYYFCNEHFNENNNDESNGLCNHGIVDLNLINKEN